MPTKRTARVAIRNETGQQMRGISLLHKYSNVYKEQKQWEALSPGETTGEHLAVDYNTGFLTTGRDWWLITWFDADLKRISCSSPNNFRFIFDAAEGFLHDSIANVVNMFPNMVNPKGPSLPGAEVVEAARQITLNVFNSEKTEGFKQHMLEEEDEGQVLEIVVHSETIEFKSRSGESETVVATRDVQQ